MSSKHKMDDKIYVVNENKKLSMYDLLAYFFEHGSLRVSDLHLKVGCPPTYRVDGSLQK